VIGQCSGITFLIIMFRTWTATKPSGPRIMRNGIRNFGSKSSWNVNVHRNVSHEDGGPVALRLRHDIVHRARPAPVVGDEHNVVQIQGVDEVPRSTRAGRANTPRRSAYPICPNPRRSKAMPRRPV
jgi:hypothetical protein